MKRSIKSFRFIEPGFAKSNMSELQTFADMLLAVTNYLFQKQNEGFAEKWGM